MNFFLCAAAVVVAGGLVGLLLGFPTFCPFFMIITAIFKDFVTGHLQGGCSSFPYPILYRVGSYIYQDFFISGASAVAPIFI